MKFKFSKLGFCFALIFLAIIPFAVLMIPLSMGYSVLWITVMAFPWNNLIARIFGYTYSNWDVETIVPGIVINIIILYLTGFTIEKLLRALNNSKPLS